MVLGIFSVCRKWQYLALTWVEKWVTQRDASGFIILNNYILLICELDHNMVLEINTLKCKIHKTFLLELLCSNTTDPEDMINDSNHGSFCPSLVCVE